jgi:hypothetical protein
MTGEVANSGLRERDARFPDAVIGSLRSAGIGTALGVAHKTLGREG